MKQARGEVRLLVIEIGKIQDLVGKARGAVMDDRSPSAFTVALESLERAFDLCVSARGNYDVVWEKN